VVIEGLTESDFVKEGKTNEIGERGANRYGHHILVPHARIGILKKAGSRWRNRLRGV
jgi:hypothetical protein